MKRRSEDLAGRICQILLINLGQVERGKLLRRSRSLRLLRTSLMVTLVVKAVRLVKLRAKIHLHLGILVGPIGVANVSEGRAITAVVT